MKVYLRTATFQEVLPLWSAGLWPNRNSPINPVSPLDHQLRYSFSIKGAHPTFWILESQGKVVGTLSGFQTGQSYYRVRGLYIEPAYRGRGWSSRLLLAALNQARVERNSTAWTLPRKSTFRAYEAVGFSRASDWFSEGMEFGPNCLSFVQIPLIGAD